MKSETNLVGRGELRHTLQSGGRKDLSRLKKGEKANLNLKKKTLIKWKENAN